MKDNGEIIILKDMEYIISPMGEPIQENGKIKKWMDMENFLGKMGKNI